MESRNSSTELISEANEYYQDLLGYSPTKTKLQTLFPDEWQEFCQERWLDSSSSGIYLPRSQTAVVKKGNQLGLFHEYFGHGLYHEQSLSGRKLIDLEMCLLKEEEQEFQDRQFTLGEMQEFRERNKTFQELEEFKNQNLAQSELFAIWTEYLLSEEFGSKEDFEAEYGSLQKEDREQIDDIIGFSKQYGNLATFYASGLARRTTPRRTKKLLEGVYGDKLQGVKVALLHGSRKEFSDIDVFAVSDDLLEIKSPWLDVNVVGTREFEKLLSLLDIEVSDPLYTGKIILGDEEYVRQKRIQLLKQPITQEAVEHNFLESKEQRTRALEYPENSEGREIGLSYAQTYLKNASALNQGKRKLTKNTLMSDSSDYRQMKGGK